ncbi:hypothetical protein ACFWU3_03440 [Streptomyces sp. NPDC058685]|uniref:hypothetical protein n=1 Tax=Streptomyces sp. NPDC058685 TaxID=3346598 RepID=UPI0036685E03
MNGDRRTAMALHLLLTLADADLARRVRKRLAVTEDPPAGPPSVWEAARQVSRAGAPASVLFWMLQADRPDINEVVYHVDGVGGRIQRDILRGVPFGDGARGPLPLAPGLRKQTEPVDLPGTGPRGVVGELRAVTRMRQGRRAAAAVGRDDWAQVAAADLEEPLPGFARWALATRIDCPKALRERFSDHPSFAHRMRQAGIVAGPGVYAENWRTAQDVLSVLDTGRWAFPGRLPEAEAVLRPLVQGSLGENTEAWAVLAQLLPTFTGTAPELIVTSGAIA